MFGGKAFKEVTKLKGGHAEGHLIQYDWSPEEERRKQAHREGHVTTLREGGQPPASHA